MGVRFNGRFIQKKIFLVFLTNVSLFSFEQWLKCISSQRHSRGSCGSVRYNVAGFLKLATALPSILPRLNRASTQWKTSTRIVPELTTLISLQAFIFTFRYGSHYEDLKVL